MKALSERPTHVRTITMAPSTAAAPRHTGVTPGSDGLSLRPGTCHEAQQLTELALRSKGWWGYSESFLQTCRAELTLSPQTAEQTTVAQVDGHPAGFYLLSPIPPGSPLAPPFGAGSQVTASSHGSLDMLFVDPEFIGTGVGRVLAEDARRVAGAHGWTHLLIESDPQAVEFYRRLGAEQIGERLSASIPGRSLPLLELPVRRTSGVGGARATYWR
jgi:GNAT superfamily N-acetyltransferase